MGNTAVSGGRNPPVCRYSGEDTVSSPTGMYPSMLTTFELPSRKCSFAHNFNFPESSGLTGGDQNQQSSFGENNNEDIKTFDPNGGITFGDPFNDSSDKTTNSQSATNKFRQEIIDNLNTRLKKQSEDTEKRLDFNNNIGNSKVSVGNKNLNDFTDNDILNSKSFVKLREDWESETSQLTEDEVVDRGIEAQDHDYVKGEVSPGSSKQAELNPLPAFVQERIKKWVKLKARYDNDIDGRSQGNITVTLPDGKEVGGQSWRTTPYDIAKDISKGLANEAVVAKVNDQLWDLNKPLESSCKLHLLKYNDPKSKQVFHNSSALLLGAAMEIVYGGYSFDYSSNETEFCYNMYIPSKKISSFDFPEVANTVKSIIREKFPIERLELKKGDVLDIFEYNKYKNKLIKELTTPTVTVCRIGSFIDLCAGPQVQHTGKIKAFKIIKKSYTYCIEDPNSTPLQGLCGVSYPDEQMMTQQEKQQEEAAERDHRIIGRNQELFFFDEMSPASPFFLPHGTHIYNKLIDFIKNEYRKRGFKEVITPNMFRTKLWEISGHSEHYHSNMFTCNIEAEELGLKPMNCPAHCLMFDLRPRSWRELPLRLADFGVLHRKEYSGTLSGLTRLYRFQQDDSHIFCTIKQIKSEITGALNFLKHVYRVLGFDYRLHLSTRPEKFMGAIALWDEAEKQLTESLNEFGESWEKSPGEGAFYGPKIDITIQDHLQRSHQCATIQLDFQLPIRFDLSYKNEKKGKSVPVIIHRAILGSVERMIAILAESYAGKWPFWLSPRQAIVLSISRMFISYAMKVKQQLFDAGFACSINGDLTQTIKKKIRNAQLEQFNFILVVGPREINSGTVNVRTRDNIVRGEFTVSELIQKFHHLTENKSSIDQF